MIGTKNKYDTFVNLIPRSAWLPGCLPTPALEVKPHLIRGRTTQGLPSHVSGAPIDPSSSK